MRCKDKDLYLCSDEFLLDMKTSIESAQHSIDIEYYMITSDSAGATFFESLRIARKKNVRVRLLIDGWGSHEHLPIIIDWCHRLKIELSVYNPALWLHEALPRLTHFFKINQRTHRKLVIIDSKLAYTGSINLSHEHFKQYSGDKAWLDLGLKLQGPEVIDLQAVFNASWQAQEEEGVTQESLSKLPKIEGLVRANQTKRMRVKLSQDLVNRIERAKDKIIIINPYFVPTRTIARALKRAALKGVDIRIIIPHKSDLRLFGWFNFFGVRELSRYGVRFFEYLPRILHSKLTIIDDFYLLGSSNWNTRSFNHDRELDIVLKCPHITGQLDIFTTDTLKYSRRISIREARHRYSTDHVLRPFFYFIRYWI